jgi:hypothetical protein
MHPFHSPVKHALAEVTRLQNLRCTRGRKSAHSPRHEAYHLGMSVPPNRPYHRWSCSIWLGYYGIVGYIDPFTTDLDTIVAIV